MRQAQAWRLSALVLVGLIALPRLVAAQVDLAQAVGRQLVDGVSANANIGTRLDRGDLNGDINNLDLVVAAPNWSGAQGRVYVIFGWLNRTGDFDISAADVTLTGGSGGEQFGRGTSTGYIFTAENPHPNLQTTSRDLVVGAPGAFSGKGAAYIFPGPLSGSLTPSNAAYTIIGKSGDQLGTAVETADLNHDGFREVIVGAPGNNRAYVVDIHNSGTTTIDLSTATPLATLTAPGIGTVFFSRDVTGDGIQDVAIGAPTANSSAGIVYLLKGRVSSAAWGPGASIDLPTGADAYFFGANAGDRAGASLWMADLDGDGVADLAVGAPNASAFGRAQAGQVYVFWGGGSIAVTRAVTSANVVFTGGAASYHLGASISMGAITRAGHNDLAMLASGASGGAGEIDVFYGRARGSFPASVDLAGTVSRRIVANGSDGPIEQVIVWDVLGKGSESIVAAVPTATTTAGANAGRLYLSISPTLERFTSEIAIHAVSGRVTPRTVQVLNRGVPAITWSATATVPWIQFSPASGVAATGVAANVPFSIAPSLKPGTYSGSIFIGAGQDLSGLLQIDVTVTVTFQSTSRSTDFDGDGKDDIAVFRPSSGGWFVLPSSTGSSSTTFWGRASDIPVPGDYDGDGRTDIAVYRPATGEWFVNGIGVVVFGAPGDIPVPADYDGDGRTDVAVFRPSTGTWYVFGQFSLTFGAPGDIPVPGDYAGAGYAQVAVYRRGLWLIQGRAAVSWGMPGDVPVPADYDGNGTTDIAVYRPAAQSTWYVRGLFSLTWGTLGDIPMPRDVDGDGRAEAVVYRPRTGTTFSLNSRTGVTTSAIYGAAGDRPTGIGALRTEPVGDFDGDRRVDVSVFRPSSGVWYWLMSSTGAANPVLASAVVGQSGDIAVAGDFLGWHVNQPTVFRSGTWIIQGGPSISWGRAGDVPVAADYDGDGITDIAVFNGGGWAILFSSTGFTGSFLTTWGTAGDVPVAADYDGDGRADLAVFRSGTWYILLSTTNYTQSVSVQWGTTGDIAVPGDYDGDGKADPAVFRNGTWYVLKSSTNWSSSIAVQWGAPGDVPVAADYDGDGVTDFAVFRPATASWYVRNQFSTQFGLASDSQVMKRP